MFQKSLKTLISAFPKNRESTSPEEKVEQKWGNCWQGGSWGFDTPGGFAPFPNKEIAEIAEFYLSQAEFTSFYTVPLEEVEEVHE